jgi:hypothetical protein
MHLARPCFFEEETCTVQAVGFEGHELGPVCLASSSAFCTGNRAAVAHETN